ncbi:MAG: hypothetical protein WC769_01255 [Thermodesulfovibrionales bacterium]
MDRNGCGLSFRHNDSGCLCPLNIAIAKVNFAVHCNDMPVLVETQPASYTPFLTEKAVSGTGSLTIDVVLNTKEFPSTEALTEIFEDCGSWAMFRNGDEHYLVINPSLAGGPECIVRFNPRFEKAVVYCGDMDIVEVAGKKMVRNPITYPADQLLLMYMLADREGALIHSSGVEFHDRGYMLSGRSGAGKSTISRKFALAGHEVLSDDRIVVRKIDGELRMFGTPWSGEAGIAGNKDLPLHGIFFLHHGEENLIKEIPPTEAIEKLMPVTSIPWYDKSMLAKVLTFCEEIVSACPAYDLFFRPDINVKDAFENFIPK